jgi:hypothetical protein
MDTELCADLSVTHSLLEHGEDVGAKLPFSHENAPQIEAY